MGSGVSHHFARNYRLSGNGQAVCPMSFIGFLTDGHPISTGLPGSYQVRSSASEYHYTQVISRTCGERPILIESSVLYTSAIHVLCDSPRRKQKGVEEASIS